MSATDIALPQGMSAAGIPVVSPDQMLTAEVRSSLVEEAHMVLARINDAATRREILEVGTKMRSATERTGNLLKGRFKDVIAENPNRKELEDNMEDMQVAIAELDPIRAGHLNPIISLFTRNKLVAQLKRIQRTYESSETKIESIEKALKDCRTRLDGNSGDLLNLYNGLQEQQLEIAKRVVVFEELHKGIEGKKADASFQPDRMFEHQLINNIGDLKLSMVVFSQFMQSIDLTVNNNTLLSQQVHRVANLVSNMARAGLAIQQSLLDQKRAAAVVDKVKASMETLMESNAKMIGQNTVAIASAASAPVISLDVLKASYRELQKTTQDLESLRAKTLQESKQALDSIDVVTAEIKALSGNAAALTKQV